MTKYDYTNFIYYPVVIGLHGLVKSTVFNSCNACFAIRVIK